MTAGIVGTGLPEANTKSSSEPASAFQASGRGGPATPLESPQPSILPPIQQPEETSESDSIALSANTSANCSVENVSASQSTIGGASPSVPTFGSASGSTAEEEEEEEEAPDEAWGEAQDEVLEDAPEDSSAATPAPVHIISDDIEARLAISIVPQPAASLVVTSADDSPPRVPSPQSRISVPPASSARLDHPSAVSPAAPGAHDLDPAASRLSARHEMFKVGAVASSNLSQQTAPPRPVPADGGISRAGVPALRRDGKSWSDEEPQKPVLQPLRAAGRYESEKEIPKLRKRLLCCTVM
jgi:hypothetical protein